MDGNYGEENRGIRQIGGEEEKLGRPRVDLEFVSKRGPYFSHALMGFPTVAAGSVYLQVNVTSDWPSLRALLFHDILSCISSS